MADTSNVDAAVIAKLRNDATLAALMPADPPDFVFYDVAPNGRTRFVIVSQISHHDDYTFEGRALESITYLVKAVDRDAEGATAKTAAARIDVLLEGQPLTITGYTHCLTRRSEDGGRIRHVEPDDTDLDIRWQHRGGHYDVVVSPS